MTAPRISAIETRYAGCRFRSRTEARWAVFFDSLGIAWEYEREGFELHGGRRYLPDFWLPRLGGSWFEVKGEYPTDHEKRLAADLAQPAVQDHPVYLFWGIPAPAEQSHHDGLKYWWKSTDGSAGVVDDECRWYECRKCGWVDISVWWNPPCGHDFDPFRQGGKRLSPAYEAARSARFGT